MSGADFMAQYVSGMSLNERNGGSGKPESTTADSSAPAKVVFIDEKDAISSEGDDVFPTGPMPEPRMKDSELIRKMSTIKGSVKREGSQTLPTIEYSDASDIEVIHEADKVFISLPWQKIVKLPVLQEAVGKGTTKYFSEVHIDLQGSTLKGDVFDASALSETNECMFIIENGVVEFREIVKLISKSKLHELDILAGADGCTLVDCNLEMEVCSVIGVGTFTIGAGSVVCMTDCEVTEAKEVGIVVAGGNLSGKRSKFVDHGFENMLVKDGGMATLTQCDFIGSKTAEGLTVEGKGTTVTVTKSTFINNETSSMMISDGAFAKVEDCVCFNSQTESGFEARGKGTKVKLLRCEFLNSNLHGVLVRGCAAVTVEELLCRGSKGSGMIVEGKGSNVTAISSIFADNVQNGVGVGYYATGMFRGCTMSGSKEGAGVEAGGYGTDLNMISCKVSDNNMSGIVVRDGALAALRDVVSSGSKEGCGLEVDGSGTEVWVTRGEYTDNPEGGVITTEGRVIG
ncbi:hypothetical protein BSKO_06999 [Bryopsis sp. KO-2023]|nr:hypothetical protein BSKO_06999 [Bryopsis sp. KO-2023]